MSDFKMTQDDLVSKLKTKMDNYIIISKHFYLPPVDSHCMTNEWLNKALLVACPYKLFAHKDIIPYTYQYRGKKGEIILMKIEDLLKSKNMNPTGFSVTDPPPLDWLKNVYLSLDKTDPLKLLGEKYIPWESVLEEKPQQVYAINPL
jgi:hypothetical protein